MDHAQEEADLIKFDTHAQEEADLTKFDTEDLKKLIFVLFYFILLIQFNLLPELVNVSLRSL